MDEMDQLKSELHRTRSVVLDFKEQTAKAEVCVCPLPWLHYFVVFVT